MPKKLSETKKTQTVEEKIQELAPPQVMQVVEVTEEPTVEPEVKEEIIEESAPLSQEKQKEVVSEFFSPSKEPSTVGYPNISIHKKSMTPIILWAAGVCILVVAIGVGIITISKGTFPVSFARPTPRPKADQPLAETPIVTPTPAVDKKELEIEILNGSGMAGVAGILKTLLEEKGYTVAGTGNAKNYDYEKTEIEVKADKEAFLSILEADLTGSYVIGTATATLKDSLPYNAVIIIGKE